MDEHIEQNSVDIVLTSPPYNMTKRKGGDADSGRYDEYKDWLPVDDYLAFTVRVFNGYDRVVKKNGIVIYNFCYSIENPDLPYKIVARIEDATVWSLVDTIIWKKPNGMPFPANARRLSRIWEFVFVFARKSERNSFVANKGVSKISPTGQKYYNVYYNYIEAACGDGRNKLNQSTFSTDFVDSLFRIYANKGMLVYDSFMGTGTTAVVCKQWDIGFVGSELSAAQCDYAKRRLLDVGRVAPPQREGDLFHS